MDEELNLHAIGWRPIDVVGGTSWYSIPSFIWSWGQGEIVAAVEAHEHAVRAAMTRLQFETEHVGGHGVVGVRVVREVEPHRISVSLIGTAVAPLGATARPAPVFTSDLPARDFALLVRNGWRPIGLAAGASFVYAPRRSVSSTLHQQTQNVELTNYTEALYAAREGALDRMQQMAIAAKGQGVVEVKVVEGAMPFAAHAIGFAAWGTIVVGEHPTRPSTPVLAVPLDDPLVAFDAATLE
jgi:uncharacterized protein YbjQ (UPF0145 family)